MKPRKNPKRAWISEISEIGAIGALLLFLLSSGPLRALAEKPIPTQLDVSGVRGYVAPWRLSFDLMGNTMEMFLTIVDLDGKVGATLDSATQSEPGAIAEIEKTEDGLLMNSELTFGGSFTLKVIIAIKLENDELTGTIKDSGGIFHADLLGVKATQEELDSVQGKRPPPTETRLNFGGRRVRIGFASLDTKTADWDLLQNVAQGEVFLHTLSRATKMYTDLDLRFGDVVIKKENIAKDYPGVYSLWLRRVGEGWNLVFNSQPDIWGTRHRPEFDVAEVPLSVSEIEGEPQERFLVKLTQDDVYSVVLEMTWGNLRWTSRFVPLSR